MFGKSLLLTGIVALAFLSPASAGGLDVVTDGLRKVEDTAWHTLHCNSPEVLAAAEEGLDPYTHTFVEPTDPAVSVAVHLLCVDTVERQANINDCGSASYNLNPWKWRVTYNAIVDTWNPAAIPASTVLGAFSASAETWDVHVADEIAGTFTSGGSRSNINVWDGKNQHGWRDLETGTIASTYTRYYSSNSTAVDSDAAYNTDYAWATSGTALAMDLQNIATHELGHTFGMGHSSSDALSACLTMYPTSTQGETIKRTLGTGDINGIKARYP